MRSPGGFSVANRRRRASCAASCDIVARTRSTAAPVTAGLPGVSATGGRVRIANADAMGKLCGSRRAANGGLPLSPRSRHRGAGVASPAVRRRAFSLCGVTHTLCSSTAIDMVASLAVAPIEPWDALVCTSRAARGVVRRILDTWEDYLTHRLGASAESTSSCPSSPWGSIATPLPPASNPSRCGLSCETRYESATTRSPSCSWAG